MNLMLMARLKATAHLWRHGIIFGNHRIWRATSHWGLQTLWIGCSCGKEFGRDPRVALLDFTKLREVK